MALTSFFWLTALTLMLVGTVLCDFVKFTADTTSEAKPRVSRGFGLWWYRHWSMSAGTSADGTDVYLVESCGGYPESLSLDGTWQAARAFNVLAIILAVLVLILKCVVAFAKDRATLAKRARLAAPLFFVTAGCEGFTLLFLRSKACRNNVLVMPQRQVRGLCAASEL